MSTWALQVFLAFILAAFVGGCGRDSTTPSAAGGGVGTTERAARLRTAERARVYSQVETTFELALFYKPAEDSTPPELLQLCPLIVQEVSGDGPDGWDGVRPARLGQDATGRWVADPARSTVYYSDSFLIMDGRSRRVLIFAWWAGGDAPSPGRVSRIRGFQMFLGEDGFPSVWRVLDPTTPLRVWMVSESLEASALKGLGAVLPDRRFATEPDSGGVPDDIVARVLADGPVPMGPFVYLAGRDGRITTLLCRCMPSQVKDFAENNYYELRPLSELCDALDAALGDDVAGELLSWDSPCHSPDGAVGSAAMALPLRLPSGF